MKKKHRPNILGIIPARLDSLRLPRKVLLEIHGRALFHHAYARLNNCSLLSDLLVATDSSEIESYCLHEGIKVLRTASTHQSGTDRIWEVAEQMEADIYVNVQGDEPMVTPRHVELLVKPFKSKAVGVTTLKTHLEAAEVLDPNVTKVVTNLKGWALYFSRSPIPYARHGVRTAYFKHLGLYAYRREILEKFVRFPTSKLEQSEKLEQLRLLENGIPIYVVETDLDTIGVDSKEDFLKAKELFSREKPQEEKEAFKKIGPHKTERHQPLP